MSKAPRAKGQCDMMFGYRRCIKPDGHRDKHEMATPAIKAAATGVGPSTDAIDPKALAEFRNSVAFQFNFVQYSGLSIDKAIDHICARAEKLIAANTRATGTGSEPADTVENDARNTPWPECPITRRPFFMNVHHPEMGKVPTFGGPFDSYTIPEMDDDGELRCERYDHDAGDWVEGGEPTGLWIVIGQPDNRGSE